MMKAQSSRPASKRRPETVNQYIAAVPEPARARLKEMRTVIRACMPADAEETISYGIPAFRRKRVLVWYAAFSDHCSLFPTASVIAKFGDELKDYKVAKGTVQFPLGKRLPVSLITKLVKARLAEADA